MVQVRGEQCSVQVAEGGNVATVSRSGCFSLKCISKAKLNLKAAYSTGVTYVSCYFADINTF